MFDPLLKLYAFNLGYCKSLVEDINEDELWEQPTEGVNTPGWLLGHLAICTDFALKLTGHETHCPKRWHKVFGPTSSPLPDEEHRPSKQELLDALEEGHAAVTEALPGARADLLEAPNPLTELRPIVKALPTVADLIGHLLTTHEASHLGHLSNWRRQKGRAPLF